MFIVSGTSNCYCRSHNHIRNNSSIRSRRRRTSSEKLLVVLPVIRSFCFRFLLFMNIVIVSARSMMTSSSAAAAASGSSKNAVFLPSSSVIRSVAVVGGTHGNEYTGVFCMKALERKLNNNSKLQQQQPRKPPPNDDDENQNQKQNNNSRYPFRISTLLGNPVAFQRNKRFIDEDLNRQFTATKMTETRRKLLEINNNDNGNNNAMQLSVEEKRAMELNQLLGPKKFLINEEDKNHDNGNDDDKPDFIIDLHTTTANMNTSLIVGQGDPLSTQCAAYVMSKMMNNNNDSGHHTCRVMMHTHESSDTRPNLASIGKHSLTIEVGPVPQGVIRHDKVEEMDEALYAVLEFLKRLREEPETLMEELQRAYPDGIVPCYRSAPAKRKGEMSAKLVWPTFDKDDDDEDDPEFLENENFPKWIIHKNVQDRDFHPIDVGDPLFVTIDGDVIPYDGSHGPSVLLMFINEGGYYYKSSGTGISVAMKDRYELMTGMLKVKKVPSSTIPTSSSSSTASA